MTIKQTWQFWKFDKNNELCQNCLVTNATMTVVLWCADCQCNHGCEYQSSKVLETGW